MTIRTLAQVQSYFNTGDVPSETQFGDAFHTAIISDDVVGALSGASVPSAANPFVTAIVYPTNGQIFRAINFTAVDANCRNWNENISTWTNTGGGANNNTWQWGYNNAAAGGPLDATEPAFYLQMESNYNPTATLHVPTFEYHLNYYAAGSSTATRAFQVNVARDGSWFEWFYHADKTHFADHLNAEYLVIEPGGISMTGGALQQLTNNILFLKQFNATNTQLLNIAYVDNVNSLNLGGSGVAKVFTSNTFQVNGNFDHYGSKVGFFGVGAVSKPTGVAVTAAGIHAALVTLGLIAA